MVITPIGWEAGGGMLGGMVAAATLLVPLIPILPAIIAGASLLGGLFGNKNNDSQQQADTTLQQFLQLLQQPQFRDLLQLQQAQALRQEPLSQAVNQLAFQLLPTHARTGIDFFRVPTPSLPTFPPVQPAGGSAGTAGQTAPLQYPTGGGQTLTPEQLADVARLFKDWKPQF